MSAEKEINLEIMNLLMLVSGKKLNTYQMSLANNECYMLVDMAEKLQTQTERERKLYEALECANQLLNNQLIEIELIDKVLDECKPNKGEDGKN